MFTLLRRPSSHPDMGANLQASGETSFRVWAPNAKAAEVLVRLDSGDPYARFPLAPDADADYYSGDLSGVTAGHEYRFNVTNDPAKGPNNPGGDFEHVDPYARQVRDSNIISPGYVVDPTFAFSPFKRPAPDDLIIYQLHVGSFRGKNDTISPQHRATNCKDVIPKLPDIAAMGFTAVQFLPTGEFPGDVGEGYAPTNFFAPESAQGSPDDLRQLVDACHQNGLAVILDVIYNHVPDSDENLKQFDGNFGNRGRGIYYADASDSDFGPRLDCSRPAVHDFFLDNARMWFREYNADGLRLDSLHNVFPFEGAKRLIADIASEFPDRILIAEYDNPAFGLSNFRVNAAWDMAGVDNFRDSLQSGSLQGIRSTIEFWAFPHARQAVRYLLGSHDQIYTSFFNNQPDSRHAFNRYFVERAGGVMIGRDNWTARAKARLAWALNVTMPGTPMLFMGSEVHHYGYWNPDLDQFGDHRYDWALFNDQFGTQMRALITDANCVRKTHPALRSDTLQFPHWDPDNFILAFKRWNDQGDIILTVVNIGESQFNGATYGVNLGGESGRWEEILNSQAPQYGGWNDSGNFLAFPQVQADGKMYIRVPKRSVLIFRKT